MAVALAQQNKRVILIEADMRRPKIQQRRNVSNEVGLSNVLAGSCKSDEAIQRGVYVPALDVLPAGPRPPLPADILASPDFEELLKQLSSRYDMVLIDSPPALLVTDAVTISSKADAVVWVAQAGVVTRPHLARATRLIERHGMPVIGFVVNRLRSWDAGYGYEYSGSYYGEENPHDA
jgi:capsular exopolysaccharide synthesis family protein